MNPRRCPNGGKARYRSEAKARRAARLLRGGTIEEFQGVPLYPYQCPACGGWHITRDAYDPTKAPKGVTPPREYRRA